MIPGCVLFSFTYYALLKYLSHLNFIQIHQVLDSSHAIEHKYHDHLLSGVIPTLSPHP